MVATTMTARPSRTWLASLAVRRVYVRRVVKQGSGPPEQVSMPIDLTYVVLTRGDDETIPFCVTRPNGRLTFSDRRECSTGVAGSTGQWGTRQASQPGTRCTLTPTAWVAEVSRLIGRERAEEVVHQLGHPLF